MSQQECRKSPNNERLRIVGTFGKRLLLWAQNESSDLNRNVLTFKFGSGNSNDRETFKQMNKDLNGIFVADAGYFSKDLEKEFYIENKRVLFAKPRANMKKIITALEYHLYNTRMLIELNFRNLKMLYAFITSFPRSIDGYFANYIYSILAYVLR